MKILRVVPVCALVALTAVGCEDKNNPATKAGAAVQKQAGAAASALKDKAVATAQSTFDSTKKMLDDLQAKAGTVPAAAKPTVDSAVAAAKEKFGAAEKLFNDLKNSSGDTWTKISEEFTKAIGAASDAIKSAMNSIPK